MRRERGEKREGRRERERERKRKKRIKRLYSVKLIHSKVSSRVYSLYPSFVKHKFSILVGLILTQNSLLNQVERFSVKPLFS